MDRFTKIILEQYTQQASTWKVGAYGSIRKETNASFSGLSQVQSLADTKIIDENYQFIMIMGKNTPPVGMSFVLKNLNHRPYWKETGGYVYVVMKPMYWNAKNNQQIKPDEYKKYKKSYISYPVVRFLLNNSNFKNFDLDSKVSIELQKIDNNYTMSVDKYNELLTNITKQKADKAAADKAAQIEKDKQQAVINAKKADYIVIKDKISGSLNNKINVENLTNGTIDSKAFQELVFRTATNLKIKSKYLDQIKSERYKGYANMANWKGNLDPSKSDTLKVLRDIGVLVFGTEDYFVNLWNAKKYTSVINDLQKLRKDGIDAFLTAILNESINIVDSINYFKGINMNIKLKDLLREQNKNLINEDHHDDERKNLARARLKQINQDKADADAAAEKAKVDANAAQEKQKAADFEKKYRCADKLDMDLVKQVIQYSSGRGGGFRGNGDANWWYHGTVPINKNRNDLKSGISAIVHDMWGLYVLAVNHLVADFCKEGKGDCQPNWAKTQGFVGNYQDDDDEAAKWYFGNNYHNDTKSHFYKRSGKYIKKASELGKKYGTVIKSCGAINHVTLYNQCRYNSNNYLNIRSAWISMRGKMTGNWDTSDDVTFKLEYPSGTNYYTVSTDI